jgi:hypothetical protein
MSNEKTVEVKEVSTGKTRLFRKRDTVTIELPKKVLEEFDGCPLSIDIRPMSHGEAEARKRLKSKIAAAKNASNHKAGISVSDTTEFIIALAKLESEENKGTDKAWVSELKALEGEEGKCTKDEYDGKLLKFQDKWREHVSKVYLSKQLKFQKKWSGFQGKVALKDTSGEEQAEDNLRENAVKCVINNCLKLNFEDESISIDAETIEAIHPDLFYWVLSSIENESYLTNGEVLGFH